LESTSTDFLSHEGSKRKTNNGFRISNPDNPYESVIRILIRVEIKGLPCGFLESTSTDFLSHEGSKRKTNNGFGYIDHDKRYENITDEFVICAISIPWW
jgi:hypothetical protein